MAEGDIVEPIEAGCADRACAAHRERTFGLTFGAADHESMGQEDRARIRRMMVPDRGDSGPHSGIVILKRRVSELLSHDSGFCKGERIEADLPGLVLEHHGLDTPAEGTRHMESPLLHQPGSKPKTVRRVMVSRDPSGGIDYLFQHICLVFGQVDSVKEPAQVPIACMEYTHAYSSSRIPVMVLKTAVM
jgi:hypothetical protein